METLDAIQRTYQIAYQCIEEKNLDFLGLQIPDLERHVKFLIELLSNVNIEIDANSQLSLATAQSELEKLLNKAKGLVDKKIRNPHIITVPRKLQNRRGRPEYDLPLDLINALKKTGKSWAQISRNLNICPKTLYSFRKSNADMIYTPRRIDNEELLQKIIEIKNEFPAAGYRYIWGSLKSQGIHVTWKRLMQHVKAVDPVGVYNRRRKRLKRRKYRNKGCNAVWHMDGHEKLVAWNQYIHGCTDGHSRKVMYLEAAISKKAETVVKIFDKAVKDHGLPLRVRADRGTENNLVKEYMELKRPDAAAPFIVGTSTRNTRIERFWGEVNRVVCSKYREIYRKLEKDGNLNQRSYLDLLCLSYIYLPRVNRGLTYFKHAVNLHPLRLLGCATPENLWLTSLLDLIKSEEIVDPKMLPEYLNLAQDFKQADYVPDSFNLDVGAFNLDPAIVSFFNHVAGQVIPNPLVEDGEDGKILYLSLRTNLAMRTYCYN